MTHEPPSYYGYWRYYGKGYAKTTKCESCGNVALYEDQPRFPCTHCGGDIVPNGPAIWVPPVTKRTWYLKKIVVKPGYWKRRDEQ